MIRRRNRHPRKARELLAAIRRQITDGVYPPGSRLPTRDQIRAQHQVSAVTVQRALDELGSEQFIEAHARRGTFVVHQPPHLSEVALVFNLGADHARWSQFDRSLVNEAGLVGAARGKRFTPFYNVIAHESSESFHALCRRAQNRSLAGLIFSDNPMQFSGTPLMDEPGTPRVVFGPGALRAGVPSLTLDLDDWMAKALDSLVAAGRRKIGILSFDVFVHADRFLSGLRQRGMSTRPYWMQAPSLDQPASISNCVHLLLHDPHDRPDALIIDDDHYVEMATNGILAAGVQAGDELLVVAHCNFPWPTTSVVPVTRLGFDARKVLHACLDLIDRQRQGQPVPDLTRIPAEFEEKADARGRPGGRVPRAS